MTKHYPMCYRLVILYNYFLVQLNTKQWVQNYHNKVALLEIHFQYNSLKIFFYTLHSEIYFNCTIRVQNWAFTGYTCCAPHTSYAEIIIYQVKRITGENARNSKTNSRLFDLGVFLNVCR